MPNKCIFCKITKGEVTFYKVYENNNFLAFLDVNPNTKGMTLVIPKAHYPSYVFDMPKDAYKELMFVTEKVAKMLEKGLQVERVAMVMEGMGVDHAHIKLYPLHGLKEKFEEKWTDKKIFFDKYEGYITTLLGPKADHKELDTLSKKIRQK